MKALNMKQKAPQLYCQECGSPLFYIDHVEDDGSEFGSSEPYFECPEGCEEPLEDRIDTMTEFNTIIMYDKPNYSSSII